MALHKMVNGVKVDLTPEEEVSVKAEWEANKIKIAKKKEEKEKRKAEKERVVEKLLAGLEPEERELIKHKLM